MKKWVLVRIAAIAIFLMILLINLNTETGYVSSIDNKYLTEFPELGIGYESFLSTINNYLTERIGGRAFFLRSNLLINDKLFNVLEHPIYEYGKDGYVFFHVGRYPEDEDFLDAFTDFLIRIQDYCQDRGVPFIYLLNPAKSSVYKEFLPEGYVDNNSRLCILQQYLIEKKVNFVDNTPYLRNISLDHQIFNKKYDAGHWNALGAFYGVNNLLRKMKEYVPAIRINQLSDFQISSEIMTELPVSNFPIEESVPVFLEKQASYAPLEPDMIDEVVRSSDFPDFFRFSSQANNHVNLLIFQGSYFHRYGHPFLARAVETYQGIHNYQNLLNFDYYFNIFQPNFVVVTTAEYATTEDYFNLALLKEKRLNPPLHPNEYVESDELVRIARVEQGKYIEKLVFNIPNDVQYGYYSAKGQVYDLIHDGESWTVSIRNERVDEGNRRIYVVTDDGQKLMHRVAD